MQTLCILTGCLHTQMVIPSGRVKVMQIMINITRWLRTIHKLKLLPPPPPAPLFEEFHRASPYNGTCGQCQSSAGWSSSWLLMR